MTSIDALINRQILMWESQQKALKEKPSEKKIIEPIITISRQTGSRGSYFASRLAEKLDYQRLHRNVIDGICASSGFQRRIIESIDNKFRSDLELMVESFFSGKTTDHYDYIHSLYKMILSMSQLGGVILIGRGGNFILGERRGFHIRFVGSKKRRIQNLIDYRFISEQEAKDQIEQSDLERSEFIRKLFDADINDPQHYDLIFNSDYMDVEDMLEVAQRAIKAKFEKLQYIDRENI